MEVDTLLAILSTILSILTAWIILNYFSTVLPVHRNLLTRLDVFFIFSWASALTVQVKAVHTTGSTFFT